MAPDPNIFGGGEIAAAVTIWLAILMPLGFHFSQPPDQRGQLRSSFIWALALAAGVVTSYLVAALDAHAFDQHKLWFVLASFVVVFVAGTTQQLRAAERRCAGSQPDRQTDAVRVCTSSAEFAKVILEVEATATRVDRLPKRVSAIFKDPAAVTEIASKRFGPGSRQAAAYVNEHRERHRIFIERLAQNELTCREIYQRKELLRYVAGRKHGVEIVLETHVLRRTVEEWLDCIEKYDRYLVGLTEDPVPLKYQIYNERTVVLHEAAGSLDGQRLNAIVIEGDLTVPAFQTDFDNVWERIPVANRSKPTVVAFIETELLPLLT
jgi:hypothetical protein